MLICSLFSPSYKPHHSPNTISHFTNTDTTMSTDVSMSLSNDVFHDSAWPLFNAPDLTEIPSAESSIGAIELVTDSSPARQNLNAATHQAGKLMATMLESLQGEGFHVYVFIAHGAWLPDNRIVRHERLWSHVPFLRSKGIGKKSDEVLLEAAKGLRFAGLIEVSGDTILESLQWARSNHASALIVSNRQEILSEASVREIFGHAFPARNKYDSAIDWSSLAAGQCPKGDLVIRVAGEFDDQGVSIDIIGHADRLKGLVAKKA